MNLGRVAPGVRDLDALLDRRGELFVLVRELALRVGELALQPRELAAKGDGPESARAKKLLDSVGWPGKPGMAKPVAVNFTPEEKARFDRGKTQFTVLCAACHQPEGQGLADLGALDATRPESVS